MDFLGEIAVLRRSNNGGPNMANFRPTSITASEMVNLRGRNRQQTPIGFLGNIEFYGDVAAVGQK